MSEYIGLDRLNDGESGRVRSINNTGDIRRRLLDLGLTENTRVECVGVSPLGDPKAYLIRGAVTAIRGEDGKGVIVEKSRGGDEWEI